MKSLDPPQVFGPIASDQPTRLERNPPCLAQSIDKSLPERRHASSQGRATFFSLRRRFSFQSNPRVEKRGRKQQKQKGGVAGLPVEAVVDAVDGVHGLRVQGHEFALVLLDRRLLLV